MRLGRTVERLFEFCKTKAKATQWDQCESTHREFPRLSNFFTTLIQTPVTGLLLCVMCKKKKPPILACIEWSIRFLFLLCGRRPELGRIRDVQLGMLLKSSMVLQSRSLSPTTCRPTTARLRNQIDRRTHHFWRRIHGEAVFLLYAHLHVFGA